MLSTGVVSAQENTAKPEIKTEQVAKQETKKDTPTTQEDSNAKLLEAIKKAKENHVVVELTKDVNYKTANEAFLNKLKELGAEILSSTELKNKFITCEPYEKVRIYIKPKEKDNQDAKSEMKNRLEEIKQSEKAKCAEVQKETASFDDDEDEETFKADMDRLFSLFN